MSLFVIERDSLDPDIWDELVRLGKIIKVDKSRISFETELAELTSSESELEGI